MSSRTSSLGQRSPSTCSLSASPVPTPRVNRPSSWTAAVAAACATIAGCSRTVGAVTAVVTGSEQACERAPITPHTNGLCPCSSFHGWKWSLIHSASKPACSASTACSTSCFGSYSSLLRKYPIRMTSPPSSSVGSRSAGRSRRPARRRRGRRRPPPAATARSQCRPHRPCTASPAGCGSNTLPSCGSTGSRDRPPARISGPTSRSNTGGSRVKPGRGHQVGRPDRPSRPVVAQRADDGARDLLGGVDRRRWAAGPAGVVRGLQVDRRVDAARRDDADVDVRASPAPRRRAPAPARGPPTSRSRSCSCTASRSRRAASR